MMLRKKRRRLQITDIEWNNLENRKLYYFVERNNCNFASKAKINIREFQCTVFITNGKIADVLHTGIYELSAQILPVLWALKSLQTNYNRQIDTDILFLDTGNFIFDKLAIINPVIIKDKHFGAIKIRAFAKCSFKIKEPIFFAKHILQLSENKEDSQQNLRNKIANSFQNVLKDCNIPVSDFAGNFTLLSDYIKQSIQTDLNEIGIEINDFVITNLILPEGVEIALKAGKTDAVIPKISEIKYPKTEDIEAEMKKPYYQDVAADSKNSSVNQTVKPIEKYYIINGTIKDGPFDSQYIIELIRKGKLTSTDILWQASFDKGHQIKDIDEFGSFFD